MTNTEIKNELLEFLIFAPDEIKKLFHFHEGDDSEFYFCGFIFRNEEVLPFDIAVFDSKDQSQNYINLKPTLLEIAKNLNLLHACFVLNALTDKYTRETAVVENNIIENLKYYDSRFKHKSTIHITKHRSRERKFIKSDKFQDDKRWNTLLISTFYKTSYVKLLGEYRREGLATLFMYYPCKEELITYQNEYSKSIKLRKRQNKNKY